VQTPGGVLTSSGRARAAGGFLPSHRWRYRWARESAAVLRGRRAAGGGACVLGDIRRDIDDVLAGSPDSPLLVVNLEHGPPFADERPGPLELPRRGRPIMLTASTLSAMIDKVAGRPAGASLLLTNLRRADLRALGPRLGSEPRLLGFRREIGFWLLLGAAATAVPPQWRSPKARPTGMRKFAEQPTVV